MTIGISALINAVTSHASASGHFDVVQGHEPKSPPGNGLTYAVFLSALGPARTGSGLNSTSARVELTGRIFLPFISQPEDLIDPAITEAADDLFDAYAGDFELGGNARNIDLRGGQGAPLSGRYGYQTIAKTTFRVFDIIIPIIVNDAWVEAP